MAKLTTEEFIKRSQAVHGNRYDYSKVEYADYRSEVCIICREHGEFWQKPKNHLSGYGCPICSGRKKMRTSDFIKKARSVHGDKYDYSKAEYKGNTEKICIICQEHGEFWQRANNHLKGVGCPKCGIIISSSKQRVWTKERCYELAKQYKDLTSFAKESQVAYGKACKNGWIIDYTWLERKKTPNGFWTKDRVLEEARKYTSYSEFEKESSTAFNAARNHGWTKDCTWFQKPKNAKKWDYNTCFDEAQKYTSKQEFRIQSITAYTVARKHGWLEEYVWLGKLIVYSYDVCLQEARKYEYLNDFRSGSHRAYLVARSQGWLKKFDWLIKEPTEPYNKKWKYDTCFAEAKKYKTRSAFNKKCSGAYDVARRNGWLKDYTWMPDITAADSKVDSVYIYLFKEHNAVYVGRTLMYRQHIRDVEHQNMENDTVYKYAEKNHCKIPPMQIIEENLTIIQGRVREDFWRKHYESKGFVILNKATTGAKSGSLGAIGRGKWTFEKAYKIAQAFHTVNEMCEEYEYLYRISKARGWLKKFDWFRGKEIKTEKQTKWTEEICRKEAMKYASRKEFRRMCKGAYDKSKEMGWLDSYTWLFYYRKHLEWNYDSCKEEASKYANRNEFGKHSYGAYTCARLNGWLDEFYPVPLRRFLNYETCKQLTSKYNTKGDLLASDRSLYSSILKKGWMKEFFPDNDD